VQVTDQLEFVLDLIADLVAKPGRIALGRALPGVASL
jgi:hypothetical protein